MSVLATEGKAGVGKSPNLNKIKRPDSAKLTRVNTRVSERPWRSPMGREDPVLFHGRRCRVYFLREALVLVFVFRGSLAFSQVEDPGGLPGRREDPGALPGGEQTPPLNPHTIHIT